MNGPLRLFQYRIPLRQTVTVGGQQKTNATGFLLAHESHGKVAWGDIAPLDGYSVEHSRDVRESLKRITPTIESMATLADRYPSVRWALDTLLESTREIAPDVSVPLARLVTQAATESMLGEVSQAVADGFQTIKLKVGGRPVTNDIDLVRRVASSIPSGVRLRLDANRQWSEDEAIQFARATEDCPIEFVEEPLRDGGGYESLENVTQLPLALDESLTLNVSWLERTWKNLSAVVIKPTLLGGRKAVVRRAAWARDRGANVVISSMYESGVGIRHLLRLAAEISPETAAGLDTYGMLEDDIVRPALRYQRGRWMVKQADPSTWSVDMSKLETLA